jgi:hypothetical protein
VHNADHLVPLDLQCFTCGDGGGSRHMPPTHGCERLLANEVTRGEKRDGGFFAVFRNNGQLCAAALKIEERVSETSLGEEGLLWFQLDDSSPQAGLGQKYGSVKCNFLRRKDLNDPFQKAAMPEGNSDEHATASDLREQRQFSDHCRPSDGILILRTGSLFQAFIYWPLVELNTTAGATFPTDSATDSTMVCGYQPATWDAATSSTELDVEIEYAAHLAGPRALTCSSVVMRLSSRGGGSRGIRRPMRRILSDGL